jgi:hypothetical protein
MSSWSKSVGGWRDCQVGRIQWRAVSRTYPLGASSVYDTSHEGARSMELSLDRMLGIFGALGVIIGVGVAIATDPKIRSEMLFAIGCFIFSGVALCLTGGIWAFNTNLSLAKRLLISGPFFAVVCISMMEASRWANGRYVGATSAEKANESKPELSNGETKQEPLTLKGLFLTDFGPNLYRNRWDDRTLTIGSKSNKFPEVTVKFTPQLWIDVHEGTKFLGFYIPNQASDPEEAERKTVLLCKYLPGKFAELLKMLEGLQVYEPKTTGSTIRQSDLPLSRQVYIYHEDPIFPPDMGDLIREYEARQILVEFRGSD